MKINRIKYLLLCLGLILSAASGFALDLKSDDGNYSVTVPGTWTVTFQNQDGFSITSADGDRTMTLMIANTPFGTLDSNTIAQIKQGLAGAGSKEVSSTNYVVNGVPGFETVQRIGNARVANVMVTRLMIASGRLYTLHSSVMGGDATQDSEMQQGLASFHLLHPPKISAGRIRSLGVKLAILGVIIAGIAFLVRRSRKI